MTDESPDYMTDEVPEYTADELGDHDDLLAEGRLGRVEHIGARWRIGFVRYEPDGHGMTVRLVAEATPQGDPAIIDLVVAEAAAIVQRVTSVNHVYLDLTGQVGQSDYPRQWLTDDYSAGMLPECPAGRSAAHG